MISTLSHCKLVYFFKRLFFSNLWGITLLFAEAEGRERARLFQWGTIDKIQLDHKFTGLMSKADYYQLLGVAKGTSASELKAAYRKMAMQYHPDRNPGNQEAEEMFKQVSEAYEVLSDDRKRQIYDQYGHAGLQNNGGFGGGGFSSAEDIFSSFGDIFEDFFGSSSRRRSGNRARRGKDIQTEVQIEFLEACFGVSKEIHVKKPMTCETCSGSGAKAGYEPETCGTCGGHGQVQMTQGFFTINTNCPHCQGQGQVIKEKCSDCQGRGVQQKGKDVTLKVPPGVSHGTRLLIHGEGDAGDNGGPYGDLYVYLNVKPHDEFLREEDHILTEQKIMFPQLALGCELEIKTIDGTEQIKIKPGTQSGEVVRLKSKGVPHVRSGKRGDHLIHIQGVTPEKLSSKQKELMEELAQELGVKTAKKSKKKKGIFG